MSDEVISQIAKLVQLAIITGTDIVDNLRMIRVQVSDSDDLSLVLTPEYREIGDKQIQSLLSEIEGMSHDQDDQDDVKV
jgi:uncharacterized protein YlaN (UPF0358 family)|tara:strand:- start:3648 stop:3884 length:237 start_codon:yes stop_codon:yes gene_type:complete